mmetsp:Transcript_14677/g.29778  ORF Transcript_14677/g.29778 Transcript_14677/m.29778 type:complete len:108 (-) Transcript_14677:1048-1371(-)
MREFRIRGSHSHCTHSLTHSNLSTRTDVIVLLCESTVVCNAIYINIYIHKTERNITHVHRNSMSIYFDGWNNERSTILANNTEADRDEDLVAEEERFQATLFALIGC